MTDHSTEQLAQREQAPNHPLYRSSDPRRKSPALAAFLSMMPGLGQVYVGYYQRGFTHVLIAGSVFSILISAGDQFALFPLALMFLLFFVLYNVIDAYRRASMLNLSLDGVTQIDLPDDFSGFGLAGSYLGGIALTIFGVVALSATAFDASLAWMEDWWPIVPIALGAYLTLRAYQDSQAKEASVPEED